MIVKRLVYITYYLRNLDVSKFKRFVKYVSDKNQITPSKLFLDIFKSSLKYNISLLDFFYFKFYDLADVERQKYAGTGFMYEYQLKMNPTNKRDILENKRLFLRSYSAFVNHYYCSKEEFLSNKETADRLLNNESEKVVLKVVRWAMW